MTKYLLILFFATGLVFANNVGLNINSDDIEIEGKIEISPAISLGSGINYFIDLDYLHTGRDTLFKSSFGASNILEGAEGLNITLGIEGVFSDNYVAVPLFGEIALRLPLDEPMPATTLRAGFSYAPSTLAFIDAEGYLEYRFEADMEMISNIHLYGGYRNIDTDYEKYDYHFNDSWYGGLKIHF